MCDDSKWEPFVNAPRGPRITDITVKAHLFALPGLLAAPTPGQDLFGTFVQTEDHRIIVSPVMRAAIAFKWRAFGLADWRKSVAKYVSSAVTSRARNGPREILHSDSRPPSPPN